MMSAIATVLSMVPSMAMATATHTVGMLSVTDCNLSPASAVNAWKFDTSGHLTQGNGK